MTSTYLVPFEAAGVESFRRVPYSRGPARAALALLVLFVLGAAALAVVPWQQTAYGEGQVIAYSPSDRPQNVDAPVGGRLDEWFVREGSRVRRGDPIARIVDVDPEILSRLRSERDAVRARVRAAEAAVATARIDERRQARLVELGLSAPRDAEQARLKVAEAQQSLASARADLTEVETRLARQDAQVVSAPSDGVVVRVLEGVGGMLVSAGARIATVVPAQAEPAVELWMDGNELPLMRTGDEVRIQLEGWPALQLSGWPGLAVGTFGGRLRVIDAAQTDRPGQFRVLVTPSPEEPWPMPPRLRQGVRAHGWVLLGRVPLGLELWRRFNDFPPQRPEPTSTDEGSTPEAPYSPA